MLATLGMQSLDALVDATVPEDIRMRKPLALDPNMGEFEALAKLRVLHDQNHVFRSYIGMGYYDCITPPVIQRNILENPGWYTPYTPYQAEIAQGRLEALLTFQTMVADLTGLPLANASLLDEATAAAEAMMMCLRIKADAKKGFFVAQDCHPQTIAVLQTRAQPFGITLHIGPPETIDFQKQDLFGILLQYPATDGAVRDYSALVGQAHAAGVMAVVATDPLALTLLRPPGEFGADIAVGSSQRFGVPLGCGGPHAAFLSTKDEYKRQLPGRIVGLSRDAHGKPAYRLALQTREQHIRREKATSNICTAQVLLAVMASMYGVYHGPKGLKAIAERVHGLTIVLENGLKQVGINQVNKYFFDTLKIDLGENSKEKLNILRKKFLDAEINLRYLEDRYIGISLDETTELKDVEQLISIFTGSVNKPVLSENGSSKIPQSLKRTSKFMQHPVFNTHHSETEMLRYMKRLENKDLALNTSMIALGSCTMKLNGTTEMIPVTWPEFGNLHPFVPVEQAQGYAEIFKGLEHSLSVMTGFPKVSLQPNSGA